MSFGTQSLMNNLMGFASSYGGDYEFEKRGNKLIKRKASSGRGRSKRSKKDQSISLSADSAMTFPQSYAQSWEQSVNSHGIYQPQIQMPFALSELKNKFVKDGSFLNVNPINVGRSMTQDAAVATNLPKLQQIVRKSYKPAGEFFDGTYCPAPFMPRGVCLQSKNGQWNLSKDAGCWTAKANAEMNGCGVRDSAMPYGADYEEKTAETMANMNNNTGKIILMPNGQLFQFKKMTDQIGKPMYRWMPMPPGTNPTYLQFMGYTIDDAREAVPNMEHELAAPSGDNWEFFGFFSGLTGNVVNNIMALINSDDPQTVARSYMHAHAQNRMNVDVAADYKFVAGYMAAMHMYRGGAQGYGHVRKWAEGGNEYEVLGQVWENAHKYIESSFSAYSDINIDAAKYFKEQIDAWRDHKYKSYISHSVVRNNRGPFGLNRFAFRIGKVNEIAAMYAVCYNVTLDRYSGKITVKPDNKLSPCTWDSLLATAKGLGGKPDITPDVTPGENIPKVTFKGNNTAERSVIEDFNKKIDDINNNNPLNVANEDIDNEEDKATIKRIVKTYMKFVPDTFDGLREIKNNINRELEENNINFYRI